MAKCLDKRNHVCARYRLSLRTHHGYDSLRELSSVSRGILPEKTGDSAERTADLGGKHREMTVKSLFRNQPARLRGEKLRNLRKLVARLFDSKRVRDSLVVWAYYNVPGLRTLYANKRGGRTSRYKRAIARQIKYSPEGQLAQKVSNESSVDSDLDDFQLVMATDLPPVQIQEAHYNEPLLRPQYYTTPEVVGWLPFIGDIHNEKAVQMVPDWDTSPNTTKSTDDKRVKEYDQAVPTHSITIGDFTRAIREIEIDQMAEQMASSAKIRSKLQGPKKSARHILSQYGPKKYCKTRSYMFKRKIETKTVLFEIKDHASIFYVDTLPKHVPEHWEVKREEIPGGYLKKERCTRVWWKRRVPLRQMYAEFLAR